MRSTFPEARFYDLLRGETYSWLLRRPSLIEEETNADELVVVDEVQKLPGLWMKRIDSSHPVDRSLY